MRPAILSDAKRPVLVFGAGAQSARDEAVRLADYLQIPVCLTWGAADMFAHDHPLRIGTFGTHGTRAANFAVQNADYLFCVGTRLDTKATGTPAKWFAREARITMVDIDGAEIDKMKAVGVEVNGIRMSAHEAIHLMHGMVKPDAAPWLARCQAWRKTYPAGPGFAYDVIRAVSAACNEKDIIVSDTGCALAWAMQAWEFKRGQRFLHPFNQTPMGYALPAAIGAHAATGRRVVALCGDGSIMMSIGELATIAQRKLPVKIVLFDNKGHAMCRQTQREWMGGTYPSTSVEGGLSFPDFSRTLEAFGIPVLPTGSVQTLAPQLAYTMNTDAARALLVEVSPDEDVTPKARFGAPNEDQYPPLSREELQEQMCIPLVS